VEAHFFLDLPLRGPPNQAAEQEQVQEQEQERQRWSVTRILALRPHALGRGGSDTYTHVPPPLARPSMELVQTS